MKRRRLVQTTKYAWRNGADGGGGYANAIAASPVTPGLYFLAGDTWDLRYTTNGGDLWVPCNWGAKNHYDTYGRACAWSTKYPTRCYVSTGGSPQFPGGGGFAKVEGYRFTYQNKAYGSDPSGTDQQMFPRACGDFIQVDYDSVTGIEWIYVLSNQGLARSQDEGKTWTPIQGAAWWKTNGHPGLAWADALLVNSDTLLVATYRTSPSVPSGGKVFLVTGLRSAKPTVTRLATAPGAVEDLALIGGTVYAAAHQGIYRVTGIGYATWTLVSGSSQITSARAPQCIAGFVTGGATTLYVGTGPIGYGPGNAGSASGKNVAKSTDGGATWTFPCASSKINYQVFGQPNGTSWWLRSGGLSQLDNPNFNVQSIIVDPFDTTKITLCGRAGAHQSRDGGATWHPAGNGACGGSNGGTVSNSVGIIVASSTGTVVPRDITRDGVSIADDFFRGGATNIRTMAVSSEASPTIYVGLGAGGVLTGSPA